MAHLPTGLLQGLRVLDATTTVAGQWCGRLLADSGAEVLTSEPAGGSPTRRLGPRAADGTSLLWRHLSAGKRPGPGTGAVDVVLHDEGALPDVGTDAVTCAIGDFPEGPYAGWVGGELVQQALSGTMAVTGSADRRPLYGVGHRASYAAGTTAFSTVLAALLERERSGLGQATSASVYASAAAMAQNVVSQHSYNGSAADRERYPGLLAVLEALDGWVVVFLLAGWDDVCDVFHADELREDPRFVAVADRFRHWPQALEVFAAKARELPAQVLVERAQKRRISLEQVADLPTLLASEQWAARGVVDTGSDGRPRLGPAFRVTTTAAPSGPAPARPPGARPLTGYRVVDLTTAWAGPLATRGLAELGADVLKVESPHRLDSWRASFGGGATERFPDRDPGARPWDRNVLFNTQGQGKRSFGLDLKAPGAIELLLELVAGADAVVSNFPPGTMTRLGLGPEVLLAAQPRLVVVEMPAYGTGGPMTGHVGMGKTMEAACGMASLMGYGDGRPVLTGPAYLDPVGGLHGTAAVLAGLLSVARGGPGLVLEVAQTEAAALWIGEHLLACLEGLPAEPVHGNDVADAFPHDAFPCQGPDAWVAVAADDATWPLLCAALDRPDLAADPGLATVAGRRQQRTRVEAAVTDWTTQRDKVDAARVLQARGVAAAPVLHGAEVAQDPALRAADLVHRLEHPAAGTHDYPGLAYRLSRTPTAVTGAAPCFGADNDDVLQGLLGRDPAEVARLRASGVVWDAPAPGAVG